jgi:hypothetical protein
MRFILKIVVVMVTGVMGGSYIFRGEQLPYTAVPATEVQGRDFAGDAMHKRMRHKIERSIL